LKIINFVSDDRLHLCLYEDCVAFVEFNDNECIKYLYPESIFDIKINDLDFFIESLQKIKAEISENKN
jgi:hypothetical protein